MKQRQEWLSLPASPLMLNLMRATEYGARDLTFVLQVTSTSPADAVVARYIEGRFAAKAFDSARQQDVLKRLGWIAKQIVDRGGNVFQVDALQPSHLGSIMRAGYLAAVPFSDWSCTRRDRRNTTVRLIRYLDGAVEIRLLRQIGGGYAFIHRALLKYFAARDQTSKS